MRTSFFLLGVLLVAGCAPGKLSIARNLDSTDAMRTQIVEQLPQGSSVSEAQSLMEMNQFIVERRTGKPFATDEFTRDNFDHLFCRRTDKAAPRRVRCWQVALEIHDERVTDVFVRIGYEGR
jgi:hypothetical protein